MPRIIEPARNTGQEEHDRLAQEVHDRIRAANERGQFGRGFIVGPATGAAPELPPARISERWTSGPPSTEPSPTEPPSLPTPSEPPQPRDRSGRFTRSKRTTP